jgi:hypothetical protein
MGDLTMSRRRLEILAGLTVLVVDDSARQLARKLLATGLLPSAAAGDALHVIVASQITINILLTWNCRHLANPHVTGRLRAFVQQHGLILPEICTPVEILGE